MINKITTLKKFKALFSEILLNKTDKISDVSDNSALNGIAFGTAKVAQKAMKDIAIVESKLFPDTATGSYLDDVARLNGVSPRKTALGSSTYVRIIADPNTLYEAGVHNFRTNTGIIFELTENFTVGVDGFGYALVRSVSVGSETNIDVEGIIGVNPAPDGHIAATNEYMATGGIDNEDDETFRQRIKKSLNITAIGTLEYITQLFNQYDNRVLRVLNKGVNENGQLELAIVTQNGQDLTVDELEQLLEDTKSFFPITDINRFGDTVGIKLVNIQYYIVGGADGVQFRVQLRNDINIQEVRREIQIGMNKYLNLKTWDSTQNVEWDKLFTIVQNTPGVRYVPDQTFLPRVDEQVPVNRLPRISGFRMQDLEGNDLFIAGAVLSPVFYPYLPA